MSELIRAWLLQPVIAFLQNLALDIAATRRDIAMNKDEVTAAIEAAADKTDKVIAEFTAATAQMAAAVEAAGQSTPAMDAALARLQGALQVADELNPDAPPAP